MDNCHVWHKCSQCLDIGTEIDTEMKTDTEMGMETDKEMDTETDTDKKKDKNTDTDMERELGNFAQYLIQPLSCSASSWQWYADFQKIIPP